MSRTFRTRTPLEALLVEHALLPARQLPATADAASDGHVLAAVQAAALPAGRELTRKAVEAARQAQADAAEKRGAGPRLPVLPPARLAQAARRPQRPDRRRGGPPDAPLPRLPPVQGRLPPARRPARGGRARRPARPAAAVPGRGSWSFDRAGASLKEFCGLPVCDNTIRPACHAHGGAMRDWQRDAPGAAAPLRDAGGDVGSQTDGTCVGTTDGWREVRLSIFARRHRGRPAAAPGGREQRGLPSPHVRVVQAAIRTGGQLGPGWRRSAGRLGVTDASQVSVIAGGAKRIWGQVAAHLPGSAGVLDIYHAGEHPWAAANGHFGEGTAAARAWAEARRAALLGRGAAGLLGELAGPEWSGLRRYFEPHIDHTGYGARLAEGRAIGSGLGEGSRKQVVGRRLRQTGARWRVRRVERMAALCAVQAGGQWDAYWAGKA